MLTLLLACHAVDSPGDHDRVDTGEETASESGADDTAPPDSGDPGETADSTESADSADTAAPCTDTSVWYVDSDGDGFGGEEGCSTDPGATLVAFDCDDTHASVHPGAVELTASGRDDDCDRVGAAVDVSALRGILVEAPEEGSSSRGPSMGLQVAPDATWGDVVLLTGGTWGEPDGTGHGGAVLFYSPLDSEGPDLEFAEADVRVFLPRGVVGERTLLLGDTDGDGSSELLLSATVNTYDAAVYLLPGPIPAGTTQLDESHLLATRDDSDLAWTPVAPGDLDGDGLADLVLSDMFGADSGGELFFFHGPLGGRALDDADTILQGTPASESGAPYDYLGRSTTNLGDLDGDGLPEIGDIGGDGGNLFYDPPPGTHRFEDVATLIDATHDGYRSTGLHMSGVGDVNGDGYRDLAMPTPADPYLLVLFGPFPADVTQSLWDDWDVAFYSDNWGHGYTDIDTIVSLGDWDADGHEDFAINNTQAVPKMLAGFCNPEYGVGTEGAVFLVAGPVPAGVYDMERRADRLNPPGNPSGFAEFLAGGSDLDRDGHPDLAVASLELGSVFVVFGGGLE